MATEIPIRRDSPAVHTFTNAPGGVSVIEGLEVPQPIVYTTITTTGGALDRDQASPSLIRTIPISERRSSFQDLPTERRGAPLGEPQGERRSSVNILPLGGSGGVQQDQWGQSQQFQQPQQTWSQPQQQWGQGQQYGQPLQSQQTWSQPQQQWSQGQYQPKSKSYFSNLYDWFSQLIWKKPALSVQQQQQQFIPSNTWVLVTGGSSGIGREFAHLFVRHGFNLVFLGHDQQHLGQVQDELANINRNCKVIPLMRDLSVPNAAFDLYNELKGQNINIDILINCAGTATYGYFMSAMLGSHHEVIQCNVLSLVKLTYLFGRDMAARGRGKILNVASTAAFMPGPNLAIYHASKAFVLNFSLALEKELYGSGVSVTCLCPGATTETRLTLRAGAPGYTRAYDWQKTTKASEVAGVGYDALMQNKDLVFPSFYDRMGALLASTVIPDFLLMRYARFLNSWQ